MKKDLGARAGVFPESVFVVGSYDKDGVPNAMNAAWATQVSSDKIALNLGSHQTTDNIRESKAFTVAPADAAHLSEADYFGLVSGRKVNKAEQSGLTFERSKNVNAPVIKEFPVTLECEVEHIDEMDGENRIVGKVVNTIADENVLTDKGAVDFDKFHPIVFDSEQRCYRGLTASAGEAWHSGKKIIDQH